MKILKKALKKANMVTNAKPAFALLDAGKPLISKEEAAPFFKRGDWLGLSSLRAERLRAKAGRMPEEEKFVREHEAAEARIQADPKAVLKEARQAFDEGSVLLLKLIRSKKLLFQPQYCDGIERPQEAHDEAEYALCDRVYWLVREVSKLARQGRFEAVNSAWHGAQDLVQTIHDMAMAGTVENLRFIARGSFFLPSLRANQKTFTYDFEKVAGAIDLSKECVTRMDSKAPHQMDRHMTRFVAGIIEKIASLKREVEDAADTLARFESLAKEHPGESEWAKYRGVTLDEYWRERRPYHVEALGYRNLPPLTKSTAGTWWEKAVKPYLSREDTLEEIVGTPLYDDLRKATDQGKDYELLDELKRRCKPKVKSLAKPD